MCEGKGVKEGGRKGGKEGGKEGRREGREGEENIATFSLLTSRKLTGERLPGDSR